MLADERLATGEAARLYRQDGSPRPVGLLGFPVAHSLSPAFQNAAFAAHNLPHRYEKWAVEPADLTAFLAKAKQEDFFGLNLTVPHKRAGWETAAQHNEAAQHTRAVNTLVWDQPDWLGYNTDVNGFLEALTKADYQPAGQKAVVIGAGGASRAAVYALARAGTQEILVINRTVERASQMVNDLAPHFPDCQFLVASFDQESWPATGRFDLVVNASSHGVLHPEAAFPLDSESLLGLAAGASTLFYDLTYGDTPFLRAVAPHRCLDGLSMLVYQGAKAFEIWTGLAAPRSIMFEAAKKALLARQEQVH